MKAKQATIGAHGADSLAYSQAGTAAEAVSLRAAGIEFFVGYLGAMTPERLKFVLDAGLAFMPVTFGGEYEDGPLDELAELAALGIPAGATVWLDLEGMKAFKSDSVALIAKINAWADAIAAVGFMPGLYVGVPQPLTSDELYALRVKRYWRGQGSVRDRNNALAEPTKCGWCMTQIYPSVPRGGVVVDIDNIGQDYQARVPSWVESD